MTVRELVDELMSLSDLDATVLGWKMSFCESANDLLVNIA